MATLAELRKQIRGIKSTRQITNAMKMVAGARFAGAQKAMNAAKFFPDAMESLLYNLLRSSESTTENALIAKSGKKSATPEKEALIVIAGERGLCGNYNALILREAEKYISARGGKVVKVFTVGRKASDFFRRSSALSRSEFIQKEKKLTFASIERVAIEALDAVVSGQCTSITAISASMKAGMRTVVSAQPLLPVTLDRAPAELKPAVFDCEPASPDEIIAGLIPLWFKSKIYTLITQSVAAELAERMRAMDNATRNAAKLIEQLTLEVNKTRQANITRELTEITGTGEVVKS
jgi:F-type H+-transporting ATPase subunit gamma